LNFSIKDDEKIVKRASSSRLIHYTDVTAVELYYGVEKILKALIAFQNKKIPKIHDIYEGIGVRHKNGAVKFAQFCLSKRHSYLVPMLRYFVTNYSQKNVVSY